VISLRLWLHPLGFLLTHVIRQLRLFPLRFLIDINCVSDDYGRWLWGIYAGLNLSRRFLWKRLADVLSFMLFLRSVSTTASNISSLVNGMFSILRVRSGESVDVLL
jgi:hypothetical protein